jgi:hypothetical protein
MRGKGFGSLLFKINTLGKFNMWGDFRLMKEPIILNMEDLLMKFAVRKGETWQSYESTIELRSRIQNDGKCSGTSFNAKVPVEVIIGIRGDLTSPEPDFNIENSKCFEI